MDDVNDFIGRERTILNLATKRANDGRTVYGSKYLRPSEQGNQAARRFFSSDTVQFMNLLGVDALPWETSHFVTSSNASVSSVLPQVQIAGYNAFYEAGEAKVQ